MHRRTVPTGLATSRALVDGQGNESHPCKDGRRAATTAPGCVLGLGFISTPPSPLIPRSSPAVHPPVVHVQPAPLVVGEVRADLHEAPVPRRWAKLGLPVLRHGLRVLVLHLLALEALRWQGALALRAKEGAGKARTGQRTAGLLGAGRPEAQEAEVLAECQGHRGRLEQCGAATVAQVASVRADPLHERGALGLLMLLQLLLHTGARARGPDLLQRPLVDAL
mmetsp:Transcript_28059/g.89174  ORF Transcript_28059/g.89174 Transcript_28059/m.89174 type:complete len:223 (-) Transcript_28059:388-1056(-)